MVEADTVIAVNDLKKSYGQVKAVNGISFSVKKSEIFGMLGPNGAGKSTTIEMLVGLRERESGEINVLGFDPQKKPEEIKRRIGVQLQTVNLFPKLTVKETLLLFSSFYKNSLDVDTVIEKFGLQEKKNTLICKLSGGQAQRVSVAISMIGNGDIIFLDEPTAGLDPQSRQQLWEVIIDLKRQGKTVFLTTHFMDEAQSLCDRVAIIDHGQIVAMGSPQELIDKYFNEKSLELVHPVLCNNPRLGELQGVTRVSCTDCNITIHSTDIVRTVGALFELTEALGIQLDDFKVRQANLEDVFLKLTGRRIRE